LDAKSAELVYNLIADGPLASTGLRSSLERMAKWRAAPIAEMIQRRTKFTKRKRDDQHRHAALRLALVSRLLQIVWGGLEAGKGQAIISGLREAWSEEAMLGHREILGAALLRLMRADRPDWTREDDEALTMLGCASSEARVEAVGAPQSHGSR
jgi:hypothetical protein